MIFLILYLIGVILAWLLAAYINDRDENDGHEASFSYFGCIFSYVMCITIIYCVILTTDFPKPTLKIFKRNKK